MKNFIFFLLIVGVLGCESKSEHSIKETAGGKDLGKKNGGNIANTINYDTKFNSVVNRIEYEMIKVLLKNGKDKKNDDEQYQIDEDIKAFITELPDAESASWDGNKVIEVFDSISKGEYTSTADYVKPLELLKTNTPSNVKKDTAMIIKYLINPHPSGDTLTVKGINKKIILFIKENPTDSKIYKKAMNTFIKKVYSVRKTDETRDITNIPLSPKSDESSSGFISQLLLILLGATIGAFTMKFFKDNEFKDERENAAKKLNEQLDRIEDLTNENRKLTNEKASLKENESGGELLSGGLSTPQVVPEIENNNTGKNITHALEPNLIKYAGRPNIEGGFTELTDNFIAGKSLYCLNVSEGKAVFWVHDDNYAFSQLTLYPDTLLRPVCEELNTQMSSHRHIMLEKLGEGHAQWDEEKQVWKVTQKAKIKYS
jgi:hypothetical protein